MMFSRGTHLVIQALTSRAGRLVCGLETPCSCHGSGYHRGLAAFVTRGQPLLVRARPISQTPLSQERAPSRGRCSATVPGTVVCVRHLSTMGSGSGEVGSTRSPSDQTSLAGEDEFEETVKELDAEGMDMRRMRKGKSSSNSSKDLKDSMRSVGRLVPDKVVNLLDEDGNSLGALHRTEAIRRSEETGLKLVLTNPTTRPYPTYRLMTGQRLHQEQMRLREQLKTKSAPTQVKEARVTGNIAPHDLQVKRRHIQDWFKDSGANVHVRVTVLGASKRQKAVTKEQQMEVVRQLMAGLEDRVTFMNKPRDVGKDGANLMVILRPMSAKEKAAAVKQRNQEESLRPTSGESEREEGDRGQQGDAAE